ncbi:MAG: tRNA (guanine-N(7)-)-methyltransferase [Candidatus Anoxychlamydiales bacterium]|nr:tRNA (guanine-N(7)-)-methyltransferase [Candidatus Anoxychlamydiales bacterium]
MKKSDLVIPFKFEDRKSIIINRFLYVPSHYNSHDKFRDEITFENENEINIEYCSGNGEWIIDKAKKNPNINFIAVEMKFLRARQIWVKMHKDNLKNLFVVKAEAFIFTKYYLKDLTSSDVFINFPDPWPKKKHAKNRLIKKEFLEEVSRIQKKDKTITIVTDHENYRDEIIEEFFKIKEYKTLFKKPYFVQNALDFGSSFFMDLFQSKDKSINFIKFARI